MRFDVLLHQLRLFKSRSQAAAAIADGSALLDGAPVKPSHTARPGQRITLVGPVRTRVLEILELPGRSVSREAARALVREAGAE
jgi:ribosome-associated heat shock protein Hsp15